MIFEPNNRQKALWIGLAAVVLCLGIWLGFRFKDYAAGRNESPYVAVYLRTGDMYFGELSRFPRMKLKNAWHLDRSLGEDNQPRLGLTPMRSVFWGPAETMYLNPQEVVFWSPLRKDSDIAKALAGTGNPPSTNSPIGASGESPSGSAPTE